MSDLRALYDAELRTSAEVRGAIEFHRHGPLWIAKFTGGQLFVTYRDLDDPPRHVRHVAQLLADDRSIIEAEWKTRSHDRAPGLTEALTAAGFVEGDAESVMIGEATALADPTPPQGVRVRMLETEEDLRAALDMQDEVFGGRPQADRMLAEILHRRGAGEAVELWAAESEGRIVSAGRIDVVPNTGFAGIWGGATLPDYRGRGIYRAVTAARARSAIAHGARWIHSDSTEESRPILERSGMEKVTETVPWTWERQA